MFLLMYRFVVVYSWVVFCFFFFKQKTAYEMRISDWSSDVCSSDLHAGIGIVSAAGAGADQHLNALALVEVGYGVRRRRRSPRAANDRRRSRGQIGRASCRERVCPYV